MAEGQLLMVHAPYTVVVPDVRVYGRFFDPAVGGIRLPYANLIASRPELVPSLWIKHPAILTSPDRELHNHFEHLACEMLVNWKGTDATEATGEAAAAFAVATEPQFAGYRMLWGKHMHSGAGIDQIYYNPTDDGGSGDRPDGTYLIVEAKGVGARLNFNVSAHSPCKCRCRTDGSIITSPLWPGITMLPLRSS